MFNTFKVKKPNRSTFPLRKYHETTVNIGDINCLHWNWCYPGDRFKIRYSFLAKFQAMIAPNFSRMRIKSEVFFVPASDLYDHFHETIMNYRSETSEVIENGNRVSHTFTQLPNIMLGRFAWWFEQAWDAVETPSGASYWDVMQYKSPDGEKAVARLVHQMGVPYDVTNARNYNGSPTFTDNPVNPYARNDKYLDILDMSYSMDGSTPISLFPFMAYQYVYNWFYRDSVRSPEIDCYPNIYASTVSVALRNLFRRDVTTLELSSMLSTHINRFFNNLFQIRRRFYKKDYFNTAVSDPTVGVDSIAVPNNIVDLRKANQLQKFIEKQALAGNRVAEFIAAHWAFKPDNYELGRPILISSSSQNVQVSEVLQTSETTDSSAMGSRSGVANSYGHSNGSYFVAPDYGILLINMSIVPEIAYFSGVPRKLAVASWEDLAWPEFAQIGMQPIYNYELGITEEYVAITSEHTRPGTDQASVFGYAPRYSQYKMELNQISGEMATSLRFWHQSPAFKKAPNLNLNFGLVGFKDYNYVEPYAERFPEYYNQIFAVQDDELADHVRVIANFDIEVNRALPANDMPAL